MSLIVHHLNHSRSQRLLWLLEELELPYEIRFYERNKATMLAPPELKAVHPLGKSPVLDDGAIRVAETGAIIEYLLDAYDVEGRLRPARGTADGRRFTYWLHYAEGSAMPPLLLKLVFGQLPKRAPGLVRPLAPRRLGRALGLGLDARPLGLPRAHGLLGGAGRRAPAPARARPR